MSEEWRKRVSQESSKEHAASVFEAGDALLLVNEKLHKSEQPGGRRLNLWLWLPIPALALGGLAFVFMQYYDRIEQRNSLVAQMDSEGIGEIALLVDFEMILNIHEVESFRLMREIGKPDQWKLKQKKKKPS